MQKRILSVVLTLLLLVSALPLPVLAAGQNIPAEPAQDPPVLSDSAAPAAQQDVSSVSIADLAMPICGEFPDYEVTLPENAPYHLATREELTTLQFAHVEDNDHGVFWYFVDQRGTHYLSPRVEMEAVDEPCHTVQIILLPNEGSAFAKSVQAQVAGADPQLVTAEIRSGALVVTLTPLAVAPAVSHHATSDMTAGTTYEAVCDQTISEVSISDLIMPVLGEHPVFGVTLPENAPYHLATQQELLDNNYSSALSNHNGMWWESLTDYTLMTPESVFTEYSKDAYRAQIVLTPNDGYIFPDTVSATINGETTLVQSDARTGQLHCIVTVPLTARPAPSTRFPITVVNGTATVDDTVVTSAVSGAKVKITADEPAEGCVFSHWLITLGDSPAYQNCQNPYPLDMPAEPVKFEAIYDKVITSVDIKSLMVPTLDDHPDFDVFLPEDAPYHLATREELRVSNYSNYQYNYGGIWWKTIDGNTILTPESVFTNPDEGFYFAQIVLVADDGYAFDDAVTGKISADSDLVRQISLYQNTASVVTIPLTAKPGLNSNYAITVDGGTASVDGNPVTSAKPNTTVTLQAAPAAEDMAFDHWEVVGDNVTLASASAPSTTFTMPAGDVRVKAVFEIDTAVYETIHLEFIRKGALGDRVISRQVTQDLPASVPPANGLLQFDRCWISEDESVCLAGIDYVHYPVALDLLRTSERGDGVVRFYSVAKKDLPVNQEVTVFFRDGQQEVGRTTVTVRADTNKIESAQVLQDLPDGYLFADGHDQLIERGQVTFQVSGLSGENAAPLQVTMKLPLLSAWRLDNGKKTMTVTLESGDTLDLPGAQRRNGAQRDVRWSSESGTQAMSGDSFSYETLAQLLSSLHSTSRELVLNGKIVRQ